MNTSGTKELKKAITSEDSPLVINNIVTAYVNHTEDGEPVFVAYNNERAAMLDQEVMFKYREFMKKALTGKFNKALLNIDFPVSEEAEGGAQHQLMNLVNTNLSDDEANRTYLEKIAENYATGEQFFIMLVSATYTAVGKASDGAELEDVGTDYSFVLGTVNPIKLEKAGVVFDEETCKFVDLPQKHIVDKPANGFLFPAFNDRQKDIHQMVYFTKKTDDIHPELVTALSGKQSPASADEQKSAFETIVQHLTGDSLSYETMRDIQGVVMEKIDTCKMDKRETSVSKEEIKDILSASGISDDRLANFDSVYDEATAFIPEGESFALENLVSDSFNVEVTSDIKIKANPKSSDLIEKKMIDGREYFCIPVEPGVKLNELIVK